MIRSTIKSYHPPQLLAHWSSDRVAKDDEQTYLLA